MVPLQRINQGVKVCPPDMYRLDSRNLKWSRIRETNIESVTVIGRKNFAITYCDDQVFVTGGMDNG